MNGDEGFGSHNVELLLGQLLAASKESERQRATIFKKLDGLAADSARTEGMIEAIKKDQVSMNESFARDHKALSAKLDTEVMPEIKDYRRKKLIGLGVIFGLGGGSGAGGAALVNWLSKL